MKTNILYALCGIPGSGKSTYAKILAENTTSKLYSFDEYSESNKPSESRRVKLQMHQDVYNDIATGLDVVVDDLHTKKEWREKIISLVQNASCKKILIVMTTPFEECLIRNKQRKRVLPDFVIKTLNKTYEEPSFDEGWDEILYI